MQMNGPEASGGAATSRTPAPTPAPSPSSSGPNAGPVGGIGPGPSAAPAQENGASVRISGFAFSPSTLTVKAGTTVTWTDDDAATHTVTDDAGGFDSGDLGTGKSFSRLFGQAGTFHYHCAIHPSMIGTVIVQ